MPKTPKTQDGPKENVSKDIDKDVAAWQKDQKSGQYYYDDAYGYQIFKDDETEDDLSDDIVTQEPGGNA